MCLSATSGAFPDMRQFLSAQFDSTSLDNGLTYYLDY